MNISAADLDTARNAWSDGLIQISLAFDEHGIDEARSLATTIIDDLYAYELGPVLFKPTMASGEQTFRPTKEGALSYFVAHDPTYPNDGGFALKSWRSVDSMPSASFVEGGVGMWMGNMSFTDKDGQTTVVDKSFGYRRNDVGELKIVQHHSSFPYQP